MYADRPRLNLLSYGTILAVFFLLQFLGCTFSPNTTGKSIFYYNESNGITTLDPAFARDLEIMWATNQLFDGLVELDSSLTIQPCIAKSWIISDEGKTYTFFLRDSVYFHPSEVFTDSLGRKVTAHDFVYSFQRILDPEVASPGQWIFSHVDTTQHNGFYAPNDSTFVVYLKDAFAPFLGILSTQYASVVPKEVVEHYGLDFRSHPIGTGPFRFAFWYENVALVFHKNEYFWQKDTAGIRLPYLDAVKIDFVKDMAVEYQGLLQGKYDFMSGIHPSFKDELLTPSGVLQAQFTNQLYFQKKPFIKTDYLGILVDPNLEVSRQSAFLDVRFRKALAISINKNEMIEYLRNNSVVPAHSGFVPPALFQNTPTDQQEYNPDLARQLLQEIGQPIPDFTLSTTADYADLMEFIQHEWEKIGVRCKVQIMQSAAFREASAKGQLQVFRKSWLADYADAENFLAVFNSENFCPEGPNYTHFQNLIFDNMYQQAVKTTQAQQRDSLYTLMNTLVSESYVTIPLYYDQVSHFLNTRVKHFPTNSVNMLDLRAVKVTP